MNQYVTGAVIKKLRQKSNMTQAQLADRLGVSDKTVSKWEPGSKCQCVSQYAAFPVLRLPDLWKCHSQHRRSGDYVPWCTFAAGNGRRVR